MTVGADPEDPGMQRSTTCTVLPDRDGRVSDPPLQMESSTVGRGLAPAAVFRSAKNGSPTAWAMAPSVTANAVPPYEGRGRMTVGAGLLTRPSGIHRIPECDEAPLARSCRTVKGGSLTLPYR